MSASLQPLGRMREKISDSARCEIPEKQSNERDANERPVVVTEAGIEEVASEIDEKQRDSQTQTPPPAAK